MDDAQALSALRKGSEDALGTLIDRYTPYVGAVASNIAGAYLSAADVEEIVADVFVALWRRAEQVEAASLKSWLGTVARNAAKNKLRCLGRELPLEENTITTPDAAPENEYERGERKRLVQEAVLAMDEPAREIFLRHYFYGQTVAAVAEQMGLNPSTVKSQLARGREKLRRVLANELEP